MSPNPNQKRHPIGSEGAGQWAPSKNPESTVDLSRPSVSMDDALRRIHKNISDKGYYDPNEKGMELINSSTFTLVNEMETQGGGIAWAGRLEIDGELVSVYNDGQGSMNRYEVSGGHTRLRELGQLVNEGFPLSSRYEPLDEFCLVVEVVHDPYLA